MAKKVEQDVISDQLVTELISQIDPKEILSKDVLFAQLKKKIIEKVMDSELEHELGYRKHSKDVKSNGNRRNGSYSKNYH